MDYVNWVSLIAICFFYEMETDLMCYVLCYDKLYIKSKNALNISMPDARNHIIMNSCCPLLFYFKVA